MLIPESYVPVEPKHLKHVLKLQCNLNAILARGLTIDLIVRTQMKCCTELGTLLNWLCSLKKRKAPVPVFTLCQWFEKLMKIVFLLYVFLFSLQGWFCQLVWSTSLLNGGERQPDGWFRESCRWRIRILQYDFHYGIQGKFNTNEHLMFYLKRH